MTLPAAPQYSDSACWAVSQPSASYPYDVFYVYPTFYNGAAGTVMDVYKTRLGGIIKSNVRKNTAIFGDAPLYAPLYRQASFKTLFLSDQECRCVLATPFQDIINAFEYFDKHISCGRPFILAGHSQGSRMLANLLKEKFNNPALRRRMIAAYLPGYCLTSEEVLSHPWLKPAAGAEDTGIIITYNTQAQSGLKNPVFSGKAVCTNPLNWSREIAPKELNAGAVFFDRYGTPVKTIKHFTSAYIDKDGLLITPDVDIDIYSSGIFDKGIYHVYDYDFFFNNLKHNAAQRISAYFKSLRADQ